MMTENKIDMSSEESLEEGSEESSEEEERQTEYLDEEEPSGNKVDLGSDLDLESDLLPKRRNWFDRCGDCNGVAEDQVLSKAKNVF